MLAAALETEVAAYLDAHGDERDDEGHALAPRSLPMYLRGALS
ncbi:MAG TPA: hypothetical protein VKA21_12470 [Candidatus Binatia bacterium]|nr:hypothetical protein [Candidatus Binatia bacterium]